MAARTKETPKGDAEVVEAPVEKSTGLVVTAAMVTARDKAGRPFSLFAGDVVTDKIGDDVRESMRLFAEHVMPNLD